MVKLRAIAGTLPHTESPRDPVLVDHCISGDDKAWRLLCRRYYPDVSATLRKLGIRDSELEDTAQEVFIEVFRYLPSFRGEAHLKTWLYRLCINQAHRVRRRIRLRERLRRAVLLSPARVTPEPPGLGEAQARRRIERALEALSEKQRAVFVLYELENVPGKQIAEILRCPEATVWRRLHDARQAFLAALDHVSQRSHVDGA
jgi:RNA polymerase sigma-70 factor (ECF subfamily)